MRTKLKPSAEAKQISPGVDLPSNVMSTVLPLTNFKVPYLVAFVANRLLCRPGKVFQNAPKGPHEQANQNWSKKQNHYYDTEHSR
jgi:hypothetical protein